MPRPFFNIRETLILAEEQAKAITAWEMCNQLREALLDSVQHHLIADVPVGLFLSSGMRLHDIGRIGPGERRGGTANRDLGLR